MCVPLVGLECPLSARIQTNKKTFVLFRQIFARFFKEIWTNAFTTNNNNNNHQLAILKGSANSFVCQSTDALDGWKIRIVTWWGNFFVSDGFSNNIRVHSTWKRRKHWGKHSKVFPYLFYTFYFPLIFYPLFACLTLPVWVLLKWISYVYFTFFVCLFFFCFCFLLNHHRKLNKLVEK